MHGADAGVVSGLVTGLLEGWGYAGLLLLMAIESACVPLPSEIILPFAGYLAATGQLDLWAVATAGALGCNLGSIPAYWLGRAGGRPAIERWGRLVLLSTHDLDLAERFFARWGTVAVLGGRMLPVVRTFIALPAGIARMGQGRFHIYTFVGSWLWCLLLGWVGYALGEHWAESPWARRIFHALDYAILALIVVAIGRFALARIRARGGRPSGR